MSKISRNGSRKVSNIVSTSSFISFLYLISSFLDIVNSSSSFHPITLTVTSFPSSFKPPASQDVTSITSLPTFEPPSIMMDMFKDNVTYIPILKDDKKIRNIMNNKRYLKKVSSINTTKNANGDTITGPLNLSSFSSSSSFQPSSFTPQIFRNVVVNKMENSLKQQNEDDDRTKQDRKGKIMIYKVSQNNHENFRNFPVESRQEKSGEKISNIILRNLIPLKVSNYIEPRDGQSRNHHISRPKLTGKIPSLFNFSLLKGGSKKLLLNKHKDDDDDHEKRNNKKKDDRFGTRNEFNRMKKKVGHRKNVIDKEIHVYTRPLIFTNDNVPDQPMSLRRDSETNSSMASILVATIRDTTTTTNPTTRKPKIGVKAETLTSKSVDQPSAASLVSNGTKVATGMINLDTSASDLKYNYHAYPDNFNLPGPTHHDHEQASSRGYPFQYSYSLDSRPKDQRSQMRGVTRNAHKYNSKWPMDQDFAPSTADFDSSAETVKPTTKPTTEKLSTFTVEDAKPTSSLTSYSYGHDSSQTSKSVSSIKSDATLPYGYRKAAFHDSGSKWSGHDHDGRGYGESGQPSNLDEYKTLALKINKHEHDEDRRDERRRDKEKELERVKERENERERQMDDREKERSKSEYKPNYNSAGIDAATRLRNSNYNNDNREKDLAKTRKKYNPLEDEPESSNESSESDPYNDKNGETTGSKLNGLNGYSYRIKERNKLKKFNKYKDVSPWDYDGSSGTYEDSDESNKGWLSALLSPITPFRARDYRNLMRYYAPQYGHKNHFNPVMNNHGQPFMSAPVLPPIDPMTTMMLMSASNPGSVPIFNPTPLQTSSTNNQPFVRPVLPQMMGHHHQYMRLPVVTNPWMRPQYPMQWIPPTTSHFTNPLLNQQRMFPMASKVYETRIPSPFLIHNKVIK